MSCKTYLAKVIIAANLVLSAVVGVAQVKQPEDPNKAKITEEIDVVRAYKPVLAEASKIRRSPDLQNNKPFKPVLTYTIPDRRLELNADIRKLQAQELADEPETRIRNNYISAAAGNLNTGIGEIYINTGKDEALQAGAFFRHLNQEGKITGQRLSKEEFGAYGRSIGDNMTLGGNLGFERTAYKFYGFDTFKAPAPATTLAQHYTMLTLRGELMNRYKPENNTVDYFTTADAHLLKNAFKASENSFMLNGGVNKKFGDFNIGATAGVDFTGTKDSAYTISNAILKFNPFLRLKGEKYEITAGLTVFSENLQSRTSVLPAITAEVQLIPGFAALFAGYTGSVLKTSLRGLSYDNRFIDQNISIKNALEKSMISGGIKGNAGSGVGYKATAYYKTIEDMPLFVNGPADMQKFGVVYDKNTEIIGFEGEVSVNAPGVFKLTGKLTAADYSTSSEKEAWFKPSLLLSSNATFYINDKLKINGEVLFSGESKALVYTTTTPLDGYITKVAGYTDLSAGAEFRIKQKVGLYLRVNNLLDSKYERFLYYPVMGLNIFGGLNYSF